jgi:hypothetical protein
MVELYGGPEPEPEPEPTAEVKITEMEVLGMLDKLKLYEETREDSNNRLLTELSRYERAVRLRIATNRPKQDNLYSYFGAAAAARQAE